MIIGIAGKGGSGKSTSAEVLIGRGYTRGKFSGALKEMLRAFLRYRFVDEETIERMIEGDLKELPHWALNGSSPRHFMQALGGWGRREIHDNLWVDTEMEVTAGAKKLLFDDLRHDNEEEAIRKRGGVVIQLVGRSGDVNDHSSEHFVPKNAAVVIDNSGTVEELREKIGEVANDLSWCDVTAA